jgi:hypothetical protein
MPFQPGQSGNPGGGVREKRFYATLDRAIKQDDAKRLRDCVEKLLDLAAAGEQWAAQMVADRLDGKPAQQVQLSGDADAPLKIVHESK